MASGGRRRLRGRKGGVTGRHRDGEAGGVVRRLRAVQSRKGVVDEAAVVRAEPSGKVRRQRRRKDGGGGGKNVVA